MIMTSKGQTLSEVSMEFINAMKETKSGSEDMNIFFDHIVSQEGHPPTPAILASISNVQQLGLDARTLNIFTKTGVKVSPTLLAWVCLQSSGIPAYINTMIGLFAVHFYSMFPKDTEMTLRWVGETVGKGKLVGHRQMFPWITVTKTSDDKDIFEDLAPEEMFTYQAKNKQ